MLGDHSGRDHTKRCDFHNDIGHTTDDCYCLKNAIEALARKGAIKQFVKKKAYARNTTRTTDERRSNANRRPIVGVINVIVSPAETWANSKSKRKSHLRSVMAVDVATKRPKHSDWSICFNEDDTELISEQGNDPIVVSATIGNYHVHRILIDNGSAVEIL